MSVCIYGCYVRIHAASVCTMQSQKNAKQAESENNNLHNLCLLFRSSHLLARSIVLSLAPISVGCFSLARTHIHFTRSFLCFHFYFCVLCSVHFVLISRVRFTLDTRMQDIGSDAGFVIIVDVVGCRPCCRFTISFPPRSCSSSLLFSHILSVISLFFFSFTKAR